MSTSLIFAVTTRWMSAFEAEIKCSRCFIRLDDVLPSSFAFLDLATTESSFGLKFGDLFASLKSILLVRFQLLGLRTLRWSHVWLGKPMRHLVDL